MPIFIKCPICKVEVRSDRLAKHKQKVHPAKSAGREALKNSDHPKAPAKKRSSHLKPRITSPLPERDLVPSTLGVRSGISMKGVPVSNIEYVVDDEGIVRTYSEWESLQVGLGHYTMPPHAEGHSHTSNFDLTQIALPLCPHCQQRFQNLDEHIRQSHPRLKSKRMLRRTLPKQPAGIRPTAEIKPGALLVKCPGCGSPVRRDRLKAHRSKRCPTKRIIAPDNDTRTTSQNKNVEIEKLTQSDDEPRDGGEYLGYLSREDGKFGSLPLYDDYEDESSAE